MNPGASPGDSLYNIFICMGIYSLRFPKIGTGYEIGAVSKVFVSHCDFLVFLRDLLLNYCYTKDHKGDTEDRKEKNRNNYPLLRKPLSSMFMA